MAGYRLLENLKIAWSFEIGVALYAFINGPRWVAYVLVAITILKFIESKIAPKENLEFDMAGQNKPKADELTVKKSFEHRKEHIPPKKRRLP